MGEKKNVRQGNRRTTQDKVKDALSKKPTASYLNSQGLTPEELNKTAGPAGVPAAKAKIIQQRNVRNGKNHKRYVRPSSAMPTMVREPFHAAGNRLLKSPEWFQKDEQDIDVSIIIPCFKSNEVLAGQIESWDLADDGLKKEIIYVNDACPFRSTEVIIDSWNERQKEFKSGIGKIVANERNCGFAHSCNVGASYAKGKYLIFLNADTRLTPNWIRPLYDAVQDESIGIVGNLHLRKDGSIDSCGSEWCPKEKSFLHVGRNIYQRKKIDKPFRLDEAPEDIMKARDVEMVTGACFIIGKKFFHDIGRFDTAYRVGYWEDSDLCMKVHANGRRVHWIPDSVITHLGGHTHSGGHAWWSDNKNLFCKKWVETKVIEAYLNGVRPEGRAAVDSKKCVVYTAITGGYDNLKEQVQSARTVDFVAFMDETIKSQTWESRPSCGEFKDFNRDAKHHKVLSHLYFPDKEYSLWIDGTVRIDFPFGVEKLFEIYLSDCDLALFKHPERNCIYQEAQACMQRSLDNPETIRKQVERYTREGYPSNAGLGECTILLRRHTPQIKKFNEMWWEEIKNGSKRDQISFNYVAKKLGVKIRYLPGSLRQRNYLFTVDNHKKPRR